MVKKIKINKQKIKKVLDTSADVEEIESTLEEFKAIRERFEERWSVENPNFKAEHMYLLLCHDYELTGEETEQQLEAILRKETGRGWNDLWWYVDLKYWEYWMILGAYLDIKKLDRRYMEVAFDVHDEIMKRMADGKGFKNEIADLLHLHLEKVRADKDVPWHQDEVYDLFLPIHSREALENPLYQKKGRQMTEKDVEKILNSWTIIGFLERHGDKYQFCKQMRDLQAEQKGGGKGYEDWLPYQSKQ